MVLAILGIGTVGGGVLDLAGKSECFRVKRVLELRDFPELGSLICHRFEDIESDPEIDTVVELIGGMEPAHEFVLRALRAGKHVITANKLMLSFHLPELLREAAAHGVTLRFDASVGGGIPCIHNLLRFSRLEPIDHVFGIVNGTTNLILDTMQTRPVDFAEVLAEAQRLGYAEANPTADIDGIDARSKLSVFASLAYGHHVRPEDILMEGIRFVTAEDVRQFQAMNLVCRLIVSSDRSPDGSVTAVVEPTLVAPDAPEAAVRTNYNRVGFTGEKIGTLAFTGQGAGRWPTATAVLQGAMDILCGEAAVPPLADEPARVDNAPAVHCYYVRSTAELTCKAERIAETAAGTAWRTEPMSAADMHRMAASLREQGATVFFAAIADCR